jgi:membrane-associated phospholipid phosphatase
MNNVGTRTAQVVATALLVSSTPLMAQTDSTKVETAPDKTFFMRKDLLVTGVGFAGSVGVSAFDERIARWSQSSGVQGSRSRRSAFEWVTHVNEQPLTILALGTYGVGRVARLETTADVGLHTAQALILTITAAELIRAPLGRARPRVASDSLTDTFNAFSFKFGAGFTEFDHRAYPSMHSAVAFATAAALVGEVRVRKPSAVKVAAPLLYTAALIPGITRIYLNQHWASDVVAGGVLGAWLGDKVVRYAHSHRRSRLDDMLLGLTVLPDGRGGLVAALTLPQRQVATDEQWRGSRHQ